VRRASAVLATSALAFASMLLTVGPLGPAPAAAAKRKAKPTTIVFPFFGLADGTVGFPDIWIVPPNVYSVTFTVIGAQGGYVGIFGGSVAGRGGHGGEVTATIVVKPFEVLQINVGGRPLTPGFGVSPGGWNGGGPGGTGAGGTAAGGGGASDVRKLPFGLADRVLVGGGGGGGGGYGSSTGGEGGGSGGGIVGHAGGEIACPKSFAEYIYYKGYIKFGTEYHHEGSVMVGGGGGGGTRTAGGHADNCENGTNPAHDGSLGDGGRGHGTVVETCCGAPYAPPGIGAGGGGGGGGYYGGGGGAAGFTAVQLPEHVPLIEGEGPPEPNTQLYEEETTYAGFGGAGGGGGSSHGPPGAVFHSGVRGGNGEVIAQYTPNCARGALCVRSAPGAPPGAFAVAGDHKVNVLFAAPSKGSPILSYTVTASAGHKHRGLSRHATGTHSPITVAGLKNGTPYTITVTATNERGTSKPSKPTGPITPAPLPRAPTNVTAVAGAGLAVVGFTAPRSPWSPISQYAVVASPGGATAVGTASGITVAGLKNGTTYTFTVTATNGIGVGPQSKPSNPVIPSTTPGTPAGVVALAGDGTAKVAFTPPANHGAPIKSYTVTASPGGLSVSGSGSPILVKGLTNGTAYTFTVTATNANGTGPASKPSNAVTPAGVPGAPTGVSAATAGSGGASVSFTAPAANGAPITSYSVTASSSDGGVSAAVKGSESPITIKGLTSSKLYTFTVTATNSVGSGPPSAPSNQITTQ